MRTSIGIIALFMVASLASPAPAQQRRSAFQPIDPATITNKPIDTSAASVIAPLPTQPPSRFSLRNFFSRFSLLSTVTGPRFGTSNLPSPNSFPSTHYQSPIHPVRPISSGQ